MFKKNQKMMGYIHGNINIHSTLSDTIMVSGFALLSECIYDDQKVTLVCRLKSSSLSCFIWL